MKFKLMLIRDQKIKAWWTTRLLQDTSTNVSIQSNDAERM